VVGQAGFRDGFRTSDHVFVLELLVASSRLYRNSKKCDTFIFDAEV